MKNRNSVLLLAYHNEKEYEKTLSLTILRIYRLQKLIRNLPILLDRLDTISAILLKLNDLCLEARKLCLRVINSRLYRRMLELEKALGDNLNLLLAYTNLVLGYLRKILFVMVTTRDIIFLIV